MLRIYIISLKGFLFKTSVFILLALSFVTPPFIFSNMDFMSVNIRLFLGVMCIFLFFVQVKKQYISKNNLSLVLLICFLFFIELILGVSKLSNILSYYSTIFITLFFYLVLEKSNDNRYMYLGVWVKVGYLLSCSLIILFLLLQFTSINTDYFNLEGFMSYSARNYEYSIFGVSQAKNFGLVSIARVSGYFPEPQYAGLYFLTNILISRMQYIRDRHPKWGRFNMFAGLLTFSSAFYIVITAFFFINYFSKIKLHGSLFLLAMASVFFVIASQMIDLPLDALLQFTSYSDRMERVENSINILSNVSSITSLLFGHGIQYTGGYDKGLSIGFFHVLIEHGLMGLFFILLLMFSFFKNTMSFYFVFFLYLFVFTWHVNSIYWIGVLALLSAIRIDRQNQNDFCDRPDNQMNKSFGVNCAR